MIALKSSGPCPLLRIEQTHEINVATALFVSACRGQAYGLYVGNTDFRISRTVTGWKNVNKNLVTTRLLEIQLLAVAHLW